MGSQYRRAQRVWLAVYDKEDERKLRLRLGLFKEATEQAGRDWHAVDFTNAFADWLCSPPYSDFAESYSSPQLVLERPNGRRSRRRLPAN